MLIEELEMSRAEFSLAGVTSSTASVVTAVATLRTGILLTDFTVTLFECGMLLKQLPGRRCESLLPALLFLGRCFVWLTSFKMPTSGADNAY